MTATNGTIRVQVALYESHQTLPPRVKGLARQTTCGDGGGGGSGVCGGVWGGIRV